MEYLVCEKKNFEPNTQFDGQPVKFFEDWCNMA